MIASRFARPSWNPSSWGRLAPSITASSTTWARMRSSAASWGPGPQGTEETYRADAIAREGSLDPADLGTEHEADADHSVSRFGGDEFVVLLTDLVRWDHVVNVVRRVYESLQKPFLVADQEVFTTVSV